MHRKIIAAAGMVALLAGFLPAKAQAPDSTSSAGTNAPTEIKVRIANRLFPEYGERATVEMGQKQQVGDTDLFFELTEFFPHFAMIDSTKQVVSLSDEATNPAFRIKIYENNEYKESTWAFFGVKIPHFARESSLYFEVYSFRYRGELFEE